MYVILFREKKKTGLADAAKRHDKKLCIYTIYTLRFSPTFIIREKNKI